MLFIFILFPSLAALEAAFRESLNLKLFLPSRKKRNPDSSVANDSDFGSEVWGGGEDKGKRMSGIRRGERKCLLRNLGTEGHLGVSMG